MSWEPVAQALELGLAERVYSAASLMVGQEERLLFSRTVGRLSDEPQAGPASAESVFDLASLTKPLATTLACLGLVQAGRLDLAAPLSQWLDLGPDKAGLTAAHLLCHTSGLPAWRPFYKELADVAWPRKADRLLALVDATPLEGSPGQQTEYSDLGFMLLQLLVEKISGLTLAEYTASAFYELLGLGGELGFILLPDGPGPARSRIVASEHCPWRQRLLQGEVNDENAWAMGGIAGQAGLFGTARAVFALLGWLTASARGRAEPGILTPEVAGLIYSRPFHGQPRSLGIDAPAPQDSSVGRLFSPQAIGHLGFTGTSFWHEPETGLTVVLLTNRTIFGRDNERIKSFRPMIHDLIAEALK